MNVRNIFIIIIIICMVNFGLTIWIVYSIQQHKDISIYGWLINLHKHLILLLLITLFRIATSLLFISVCDIYET